MSSCLTLQSDRFIYMCADTAQCTRINTKLYRVNEEGKKIYKIGDKVIFISGVSSVTDLIIASFKQSKIQTIEVLRNIAKATYKILYDNDKDYNLGIVVGTWENRFAVQYTIDSCNNFEIVKDMVNDKSVYLTVEGIKKDEVKERAYYYFNNPKENNISDILDLYKRIYDDMSFEGIGGNLEIYRIQDGSISKISEFKIKEKEKINRLTDIADYDKKKGKWILHNIKDTNGITRTRLGEYNPGKFGLQLLSRDGRDVVIDEDGILQTDTIQIADNVDSSHPLKLRFYIDDGVISVRKVKLAFSLEKFRTYEKDTESNIQTSVSTTATVKYWKNLDDPYYTVPPAASLGQRWIIVDDIGTETKGVDYYGLDHKHNFSVTIPSHNHKQNYGIYEDSNLIASGVNIYIDSVFRKGTYNSDQNNIELSEWIKTSGWHEILLSSQSLGRINASLYVKSFCGI